MPSSTSSSDQRLPALPWLRLWAGAVLGLLLFVAALELRLAAHRYRPTVLDSPALWLKQRQRADSLGTGALIITGASRSQLDLDLDTLRRGTGLTPVQLAIDSSSPLPIWRGLVDDPQIRGTILFDYQDHDLADDGGASVAEPYQRRFQAEAGRRRLLAWRPDEALADWIHGHLASYADGASPFQSLLLRALPDSATPQYLTTLPDRSRMADYSQVILPDFYYRRVAHELGEADLPPRAGREQELERQVRQVGAADDAEFLRQLAVLKQQVDTLHQRGARVIFVRMPVSGMLREIEDRRYPRDRYWDRFAREIGAPAINFEDYPELADFNCPDGSHLDLRDRGRFTLALAALLKARLQDR